MSMNLFFTVEYDENHPEGVQRGRRTPTRPATIQIDMAVRHRAGEDLITY